MRARHTAGRGRVRCRVPGLSGSEALTRRLECRLGACDGIQEVAASTHTGNVLVRFQLDRSVEAVAVLRGNVLAAYAHALRARHGGPGDAGSANGPRPATPRPAANRRHRRRAGGGTARGALAGQGGRGRGCGPGERALPGCSAGASAARRPASPPISGAACAPTVRLDRERPPAFRGWQARWAATMALLHGCLGVHAHRGRPRRACTDVVDGASQRSAHHACKTVRPCRRRPRPGSGAP